MLITMEATVACGCGAELHWLMFPTVRINKRSMRSRGVTLMACKGRTRRGGVAEPVCEGCGAPITHRPADEHFRPVPEDAERIRAYRLKRWPELADEQETTDAQ